MDELELTDIYAAAARATINERCGLAYMHDVRGSMQALFSAMELLGRSARATAADPQRVEKAWALAKRAIAHHEKSTLEVLETLTLQQTETAPLDLSALLTEAAHFLRNDAANKNVQLQVEASVAVSVRSERTTLRTVLVGLIAAALDHAVQGSCLKVHLNSLGDEAVIIIGSAAGYGKTPVFSVPELRAADLTFVLAQQYFETAGGRLELDLSTAPQGELRLYYPRVASTTDSLAATRQSTTEK